MDKPTSKKEDVKREDGYLFPESELSPSNFGQIPWSLVAQGELPLREILILSLINSLSFRLGFCYASNQYIARIINLHEKKTSTYLKTLCEKGYLEIQQEGGWHKKGGRKMRVTGKYLEHFSRHSVNQMVNTEEPHRVNQMVNTEEPHRVNQMVNTEGTHRVNQMVPNGNQMVNSLIYKEYISKESKDSYVGAPPIPGRKSAEPEVDEIPKKEPKRKSIPKKNPDVITKTDEAVMELYNRLCPSLIGCKVFTPKRKANLKALHKVWKWKPGEGPEFLTKLFTAAEESSFLRGENDSGWKADLEFVLKPESATKILEGKYRQKTTKTKNQSIRKTDGRKIEYTTPDGL